MVTAMMPVMELPAQGANTGKNEYGHTAYYEPVKMLYTSFKHPAIPTNHTLFGFKLFDATASQWSPKKEAQARVWLTDNNYLLNKFMVYDDEKTSQEFNKQFYYEEPTLLGGQIRPKSNCIDKYDVYFNCYGLSWQDYKTYTTYTYKDAIRNMNSENTGNIGNMLEKGDIEYLFAHRIKTVETSWFIFARSHDYGRSWIMGEYNNKSGDGWHNIHYNNGGPDIGGVKGWHPASKLTTLRFEAESDRDYTNDAYLSGAFLVGRDIAGPRIKSVTVTSDREGKSIIPDGAITLDNIATLTDRTIYFQVEWDEPVLFSGLSNAEINQLTLKVQTIGKDGTSGMITEAPFLRFTPKKTDSTQLMTFEYRIPDPYTDNSAVAQERGYYYRFSQVVVSTNENERFWNNIRDIAGNKFAANSNGQQPAGKVQQTVSGAPFVDLEPFAIKNIKVSKEAPNSEFVEKGELLSITLELNKSFTNSVLVASELDNYFINGSLYENLPSITLNLKDSAGNYVTITPANPTEASSHLVKKVFNGTGWVDSSPAVYWQTPVENQNGESWPLSAVSINSYKKSSVPLYTKADSGNKAQTGMDYVYDVNSVTYNVQLYPGYTIDGDSIKVIGVTSPAGAKDTSGYTLMNYSLPDGSLTPANPPAAISGKLSQYIKSPDRQYKLDFEPPNVSVAFSDEGSNIIGVSADIADASLWGTDASFMITVDGAINGKLQFQSSSSDSYGSDWVDGAVNSLQLSFGSPVTVSGNNGQAYAFIRLPDHSEIKSIHAVVTVADEAGNTTRAEGSLPSADVGWSGVDGLAPKVNLAKKGEKAEISITDMNDVTYSYEWTNDTFDAPEEFTGHGVGNTGMIDTPDLPADANTIHKRRLWVKAKDSANNESQPVSMDFSFDRTYTTVSHAVYEEGPFINTYPSVDVTIDNVKSYWYVWVEKPANFVGLNLIDYGDIVHYIEENTSIDIDYIEDFKKWAKDNHWAADVADTDLTTPENSNNHTQLTISLSNNTPVIAVDDASDGTIPVGDRALFKWRFYGNPDYSVNASETTRPIVLLIGGVRDNDTSLIEAVEMDTFYSTPETKLRQVRFSTHDEKGKRQDNIRNINYMGSSKEGLFWPDDNGFPVNIPNLYDIAEWEFYLAGDPVTGLDRLELRNTSVKLVQIKHENTPTDADDISWMDGGTESIIREWSLDELELSRINNGSYRQYWDAYSTIDGFGKIANELVGEPCSPVYSFTISVDPQIITPTLYEFTGYNEYNGLPEYQNIRYEFRLHTAYANGEESAPETLTHWVFNNNNTNGLFYGIQNDAGNYIRHGENLADPAPTQVPAVFDEAGKDITPNIPVVTFNSGKFGSSPENAAIQFTASEYPYSYAMLYRARTNNEGNDKLYLGSKLRVRWSTDPTKLNGLDEDSLYHIQLDDSNLPIGLARFNENGYSDSVLLNIFTENGSEVTLYYQFFDEVKLSESPIYVIRVRRDDIPPVIALSVSETDAQVRQVQVKVDSVYDIHMIAEGDTTRYVIDTPTEAIDFSASGWRKVDPGESFNTTNAEQEDYLDPTEDFMTKDGREYVRVYPDQNGVFLFTTNGHMVLNAEDSAGNLSSALAVNGDMFVSELAGVIVYPITNVDHEPPEYTAEPVWTQNDSEGKFTLSALVDSTATNAYLRFDKEYTEFLTGTDFDEHTENRTGDNPETDEVEDGYSVIIPASEVLMFALGSVPGQFEGALENGVISFTGYIKHDETVKAKSVTLVVTDRAGNQAEREYTFSPVLGGVEPGITNAADSVDGANAAGLPVYHYGEALEFTAPVTLPDYQTGYTLSHSILPIYSDGVLTVGYTDLFGVSYSESIYADIFGPAFEHHLTFLTGDTEIAPTTPTNKDVTVKVDTSGTESLTVQGSTSWQTTVEGNTSVTYTLTNSGLGKTQTFTLPVTNIDKTAPTAYVSASVNSAVDEVTGEVSFYAITYTVDGFDEANVTVIDDNDEKAPSSVTFDGSSQSKSHTFRFCDAAGNVGTYVADATEIMFSDPADTRITGYRLNYIASGTDRSSLVGVYTPDGDDIDFGVVNSDIFVWIEALNANGEVVPSQMTRLGGDTDGVVIFDTHREILFTKESKTDQVVSVKLRESRTNSEIIVPVTLPAGVIDKTAPIGTVNYVPQTDGSVKVYFIPLCSDLNETNGVGVQGEKSDGSPLTLESDEGGYYVNFDVNGSGSFVLLDKAGNIGVVAIAVVNVDSVPPQKSAEGWSGAFEAKTAELIQRLLETPTNNPIKIFFSFNEHLSKTEVIAYDNMTDRNELTPTQDYVTAVTMGNTVTVEFLKNCQAKITVFDMRENSTVLWRPEDGPITVIDRDLPELDGSPVEVLENNVMKITYTFKNREDVILVSDPNSGYKNQHTAVFTENGSYILTFADRAGNVLSVYPTVTGIDELAPRVKMNMLLVGEGTEVSGKAQSGELYLYTNRNVRIAISAEDETADGITVTAAKQGGAESSVSAEAITVDSKNYTHHFTVTENGLYEVTVRDKWGHENKIYTSVSMIDTTAPTIKLLSTRAVSVLHNSDPEAVKAEILQGVTAEDAQSGIGTDGVTLDADISLVNLSATGSYTAVISAKDRLGNTSEKTRTVYVTGTQVRVFLINGIQTEANDACTMSPGKVTVDTTHASFKGEDVSLYWARGYKTAAQMKYENAFDGAEGFTANEKGYYTILAQSAERGMYLVYVYVY